ncbi:MAG: SRPBCC family protein [Chitinophagales bacterium]|nr:SRPBCC family protein [Chitinophagales bacterium]
MAFYQFVREQSIPATLDEVWDFVSSPRNLEKITPKHMAFEVTSKGADAKMYAGMIISYKLRPLAWLPFKLPWLTEITHVVDKTYFVDEQRIGPYRLWHHQHKLTAIEGGVRMEDIVTYEPPFGILGAFANALFIKKQLQAIFEFRYRAIEEIFGKMKE